MDSKSPDRGPLLIVSGEKDHTVPWVIANASYKKAEERNKDTTEIVEIPGQGQPFTIDSGWGGVADTALAFVQRFVKRPTTFQPVASEARESEDARFSSSRGVRFELLLG